jgi:hypothetical protein
MLFALLSFIIAFTMYMKNDEDLVLPFGLFANEESENESDELLPGETVFLAGIIGEKDVNPIPEKKAKDAALGSDTLFIGSPKLSGLYEYDITENSSVIADAAIKSSNLGNLLVKRGDDSKTIKNIVMDEKKARIFILLDPETEIDSEALADFCADLISNNKNLKIYFISALPQTGSDSFNEKLLAFANENGVYYLDFATVIVGNDGNIESKYAGESGGLNKDGAKLLQEYISTHYV